MKNILSKSSRTRTVLLIAALLLLGGAVAFFCGEWGPGVGKSGVISKLVSSCGFGLLGCGLLLLGAVFLVSYFRQFRQQPLEKKQATLRSFGHQTATACLNVLVYGGVFVVAMGGMTALDAGSVATTIVVLVVWGCCIAIFVLYRRYRKAHKTRYDLFSSAVIVLLLLFLGAGMLTVSFSTAGGAVRDLEHEPSRADVFLVDAKIDYPNWRYGRVAQAIHVLTFFTSDGERIVLEVPENDAESAMVINEQGNFVHLVYYPNTQVFCSADRWSEGRQLMGDELLGRLNEEYDFDL